ncbi:MAG: MarR family transcriptional regulator [Clostridia bacterium]|nr:MarR family transcriptional regulator [Clostridia bacterium]
MNNKKNSETVGLMMRVMRIHRRKSGDKFSKFKMGSSGHRALMYIYRVGDGISQKELAEHFGITAAGASGTVRKLETGGYIKVESAKDDLRRYEIYLTELGRKIAEDSRKIFKELDTKMLDGISEHELKVFCSCLEKMKDNLERSN